MLTKRRARTGCGHARFLNLTEADLAFFGFMSSLSGNGLIGETTMCATVPAAASDRGARVRSHRCMPIILPISIEPVAPVGWSQNWHGRRQREEQSQISSESISAMAVVMRSIIVSVISSGCMLGSRGE
jgi:hypothetical protein